MSLVSLEYARQAREERYEARHGLEEQDYDLAISLPGAAFTLWTAPIFTHRRGPTDFVTSGWEIIVIEDQRGQMVGYEYRDGSLIYFGDYCDCCFYWPAERFERHNLGGRLS